MFNNAPTSPGNKRNLGIPNFEFPHPMPSEARRRQKENCEEYYTCMFGEQLKGRVYAGYRKEKLP